MDTETSTDILLLMAEGPVEKPFTYEEGEISHRDVEASKFTARSFVQAHQEVSITLTPTPDIEKHVNTGFEDDHSGIVSWIFASYLDNADEEWYPIHYDEWKIKITTAKPGEHPDNLFRICAEERADRDESTTVTVLRQWMSNKYFDTETVSAALRVANSNE